MGISTSLFSPPALVLRPHWPMHRAVSYGRKPMSWLSGPFLRGQVLPARCRPLLLALQVQVCFPANALRYSEVFSRGFGRVFTQHHVRVELERNMWHIGLMNFARSGTAAHYSTSFNVFPAGSSTPGGEAP